MLIPPSSEISQHVQQQVDSCLDQSEVTFTLKKKKISKEELNAYMLFLIPHLERSVLPSSISPFAREIQY